MPTLHPTAQRVAERLAAAGLDVTVVEHEESSRTAEEAAATAGCELGQIVKSLVFVDDPGPVLVLCAGDRRVDAAALGMRRATADVVREATGSAIGAVPPLGHPAPMRTLGRCLAAAVRHGSGPPPEPRARCSRCPPQA